jgi:hypothetical protein
MDPRRCLANNKSEHVADASNLHRYELQARNRHETPCRHCQTGHATPPPPPPSPPPPHRKFATALHEQHKLLERHACALAQRVCHRSEPLSTRGDAGAEPRVQVRHCHTVALLQSQ